MNEMLTLGLAPGILWLLFVFLRVPGVTLILAILVGKLFSEELSENLYDLAKGVINNSSFEHAQLFLLLLPVVLTVILTQSRTPKTRVVTNAIPLLFASITLIIFALPYINLSSKLGENGQDIVSSYQSYIVCATGGIALLFSWMPNLKTGRHRHK